MTKGNLRIGGYVLKLRQLSDNLESFGYALRVLHLSLESL